MTDAQNTADMVDDDGLVRESARQIDEVGKLRMEVPGIEGEAELADLVDLARAFPNQAIIVDHVGGVLGVGQYAGKSAEIIPVWKKSIAALAQCPNVNMKLGGLGMTSFGFGFHERDAPPSSQELADTWRPYVETCIEAFGPTRCMFESNFPPDKQSCGYTELWNAFKRITSGASAAEKTALYSGTAARVYRMVKP